MLHMDDGFLVPCVPSGEAWNCHGISLPYYRWSVCWKDRCLALTGYVGYVGDLATLPEVSQLIWTPGSILEGTCRRFLMLLLWLIYFIGFHNAAAFWSALCWLPLLQLFCCDLSLVRQPLELAYLSLQVQGFLSFLMRFKTNTEGPQLTDIWVMNIWLAHWLANGLTCKRANGLQSKYSCEHIGKTNHGSLLETTQVPQ